MVPANLIHPLLCNNGSKASTTEARNNITLLEMPAGNVSLLVLVRFFPEPNPKVSTSCLELS